MNDLNIIIFIILAIALVFLWKSTREGFGFPFNTLSRTPRDPKILKSLPEPYCVDEHGQPVPCPIPCQKFCPSCKYDYPVPVFGPDAGAYSPNKWCPGPPVC